MTRSARSACPGRPSWSSAPGARSARRSRPPTPRWPTARPRTSAEAPTTRSRTPVAASASSTTWSRRSGRCGSASRLRRVLVVDLDVHQGDGTHAALAERRRGVHALAQRPRATTRSGASRAISSATCPTGTGDDAYLDALAALLPEATRPRARRAVLLPRRSGSVRGRSPRAAGAHARRPREPRPARALLAAARRHPGVRDARREATPSASRTRSRSTSRRCARLRDLAHANATSPGRWRA